MMQVIATLCDSRTCTRPGCSPENGCQGHAGREFDIAHFPARAQALIDEAARLGLVLTIEQVPLQPLAIGHYETRVSVRPARVRAEVATKEVSGG